MSFQNKRYLIPDWTRGWGWGRSKGVGVDSSVAAAVEAVEMWR